jgi:TonB family protein
VALTTGVVAQSEQSSPVAPDPAGPAAVDFPRSLDAARELYASADYGKALETLNRLAGLDPSPQDRQSIDLYRTFCFVALGRTGEAEDAITAMLKRDPLYRPDESETPPRVRPMFSDRRRLLLPAIVQSKYAQAKSAFDRGEYKTASEGFREMLITLSDSDIADPASRPPLSDLRVLATGFHDLALKSMTPQPAPPADTTTRLAAVPGVSAPPTPRIYDSNDADVVAPITVNQDIPPFSRPSPAQRTGELYVVIDETGKVESAIISEGLDRAYDRTLLAAAETWTYQPATRNGTAVKYRKRIQLTLSRPTN